MKNKKEIIEISDKKITSKDIVNAVGHLIGVIVFAKKLWDYFNEKKNV